MLINTPTRARARHSSQSIAQEHSRRIMARSQNYRAVLSAEETVQAALDNAVWMLAEAPSAECPPLSALEAAWLAHPEQASMNALEAAWFATGGNEAL